MSKLKRIHRRIIKKMNPYKTATIKKRRTLLFINKKKDKDQLLTLQTSLENLFSVFLPSVILS